MSPYSRPMNDPASQRARALWLSAPVVVAIGRLIDWWRLGRADEWAYYLGEPIPIFWALVLVLCGLAATVPVRRGWLRAGVFSVARRLLRCAADPGGVHDRPP